MTLFAMTVLVAMAFGRMEVSPKNGFSQWDRIGIWIYLDWDLADSIMIPSLSLLLGYIMIYLHIMG